MAELSGSLASIPLSSLVQLLRSLGKSGDALIGLDDWLGYLSFDRGQLIGAAIESETGPCALEVLATALGRARFEFWEGPPTLQPNLPCDEAHTALLLEREPAAWATDLPAPDDVVCLAPGSAATAAEDERPTPLTRVALAILLDVDGQRSVGSLAARHGLLRTLRSLAELREAQLISFQAAEQLALEPAASVDVGVESAEESRTDVAVKPTSPLRHRGQWRARKAALELGQAVAITALVVGLTHALVQNFRVDGVSMEPSFAAGEALIVNRTAYLRVPRPAAGSSPFVFGGPRRGEVVVFRAPPQPDVDYIKRVIGLPGESVLIRNGRVFVDGQPLDEPYVEFPPDCVYPGDGQAVIIPRNTYFVLGDNRPDSFDSHTGWVVPADNLVGRVWLRYWPPSAWGVVDGGGGVQVAAQATR
jgi:signal peptidase I